MPDYQVDLTNCDREPIHTPGHVQSHGFLLMVDEAGQICYYSENIADLLTASMANPLGQHISVIEPYLENIPKADFISSLLLIAKTTGYEQLNPVHLAIRGKDFNLVISAVNEGQLLEFEPRSSTNETDVQKMIGKSIAEMLADRNLQNLLNNTTAQVKTIIVYDRVMVYRFAEDGHGEVVAESRNEELKSWLGLHYPASDIPKQARELYKLNMVRLIADVNAVPSQIFTTSSKTEPLNLTWSQLRAVSPIHIQYLKNMGVASSFSISLLYRGELWGLIACHSYSPRFIDYKSRESAKLIGQILSSALEFRQDEENQHIAERLKYKLDQITKNLQGNESITHALTQEHVGLLDLTHATGAALIYEREITRLGSTPEEEDITNLINWFKTNITDALYFTNNLSGVYPAAAAYRQVASGIMVSVLSRELNEYIIWFKPELLQTIKWAGNPDKPVEISTNGMAQIAPRHSFEVWSETVIGVSDSWRTEEISSVVRLREEINYAINLKAGALRLLNEKLRLAYDELDTFSYTISHDLKNPIAAIKGYTQLLSRATTYGEKEKRMVDKITERVDQMNFMINEVLSYSRIGRDAIVFRKINATRLIHDIVADLRLIYDTENLSITIGNTPEVLGDQLMLLQVFSNLVGNAVKYSQGSTPAVVHIEGVENEHEVVYTIRDNGLGIDAKDLPYIFELFHRTDNVSHIEGSGVGLAIVKRIIEKHHGRVWAESELGKGSVFYVSFVNDVKPVAEL